MPHLEGSEAILAYEQSGQGTDLVWVAGGGSRGRDWRLFQTPFFDDRYRSTTFDGRGIGDTTCDLPQPWPIEAFARDTAELIEAVCEPPVAIVGSSLGSAIVQQVAIDRPDLLRCAVVMGTGAWSTGWAGTTRRRRSSSAAREAASTA
jgi:pimeloyl-ACP methyl ester carboxylesterase